MDAKTLERKLNDDFKVFLTLVWRELDLPKPTRAQLAIAEYLQHGPKRLQIQAFRGCGKSWIAAAFVLWQLFQDPDKKVMVISASKDRADNFTIFCQRLILDIDWLFHLRPTADDQRWSRISFDVGPAKPHQAPSVKSVGITGQLTGSRADIMIFDDVEVPANSATDMQREKLMQLVSEAEAIILPKDTSRIMFLGTPQSTFTIYRKLAERAYRPFVWPARYPKDLSKYEGLLAPQIEEDIAQATAKGDNIALQPTDTRFTNVDLMDREASMGRSNFMLQFMLDTSLSDAEKFPLKFQDLIVTPLGNECAERYAWSADPRYMVRDLNPVGLPGDRFYGPMFIDEGMVEYQETIVSVDPSGRGSDETVAVVMSQANGYVFLRALRAYRDGYSDPTLSDIVRLGKRYNATTLLIESNFGDGMVAELFKKHLHQQGAHMDAEEVRATVRKEERIIDALEPIMNQHKLIVDPAVWEYDYASNPNEPPERRLEYQLGYQMSRMCREKGAVKHDDRVDALAQGAQWFIDSLAQSAFKAQASRRNEEWQAMMTAFEVDPQQATDALVLGRSFKHIKRGQNQVYDWAKT